MMVPPDGHHERVRLTRLVDRSGVLVRPGVTKADPDWLARGRPTPNRFPSGVARAKWPTKVALVVLLAATVFDRYWVWGLVFLYWAAISVKRARG